MSSAQAMLLDHTDMGAVFRRLSLPLALTMLGDQLISIIDTVVIGALGTAALAATTGAFALFIAVLFAVLGFSSGLGIVAAQRVGAQDIEGFGSSIRAGIVYPVVCALLIAIASIWLASPILHLLLGPIAGVDAAARYLQLRCFQMIPMMVAVMILTGIGAAGNRKPSIVALLILNIVHLPLACILTLGWLTGHPFGIVGAGTSSVIAEAVADAFVVLYALRHSEYRIFASLRIDWQLAATIAKLSLPEVVFLLAVLAPDVFIVAWLAPLGTLALSAFRALNIVSDFTFIVPIPLQEAAQTVIGQRLGARDPAGALAFFERARTFSTRFSGAFGAVVAVAAWPLAYAFTLNTAVATLAALPLAFHMITLPLKGYAMLEIAPLRASGDTRFSMFAGLLCSAAVLPACWIGIKFAHIGLYAVPLGWILAWTARLGVTSAKVSSGQWLHRPLLTSSQSR